MRKKAFRKGFTQKTFYRPTRLFTGLQDFVFSASKKFIKKALEKTFYRPTRLCLFGLQKVHKKGFRKDFLPTHKTLSFRPSKSS
jgi:hypothetical protein